MSNKKETLVITGGSGFVGSHLIPVLRAHDFRLLLLTHSRKIETSDHEIIQCDISESWEQADCLLNENSPVGIIHLATKFVPSHTSEQIPEIVSSNIAFGTRLLDSAVKMNIPWFLNIGTFWQHYNGAVYDPVNLYAATKQAFESIAEFYSRNYNIRFVTLCLNDTYGEGDTRKKIFPLWKQLAETPGTSMAMSPGEQLIDILHIDDVVSGILHLVQLLKKDSPEIAGADRYYLSSGDLISLRQIAEIFSEISGKKLDIRWGERPYRTKEVMHPQCCGTPLPGWKNKISLHDGISKFLGK